MEKEQLIKLVTAAKNGDGEALNELFNSYYNDLYYFALKTVKDADLAGDITQEAFIDIINNLHTLNEPAAFVSWAKKVTYFQCTRYFKKKKDVLVDEDEDGNTIFDTLQEDTAEFIPDEALEKDEFKKTILGIIDELSEEQRSAVMMYYFDELPISEIARIQGVSEGTVKSRLNYARKAIKKSVEDYEKKHNTKLHAIPFFPLFKWLFKGDFSEGMSSSAVSEMAKGITEATGKAIAAEGVAASAAGASAAATATSATAATTAAAPLTGKIIAGVVASMLILGGVGTGVALHNAGDGSEVTEAFAHTGDAPETNGTDVTAQTSETAAETEAQTTAPPKKLDPVELTMEFEQEFVAIDHKIYRAVKPFSAVEKLNEDGSYKAVLNGVRDDDYTLTITAEIYDTATGEPVHSEAVTHEPYDVSLWTIKPGNYVEIPRRDFSEKLADYGFYEYIPTYKCYITEETAPKVPTDVSMIDRTMLSELVDITIAKAANHYNIDPSIISIAEMALGVDTRDDHAKANILIAFTFTYPRDPLAEYRVYCDFMGFEGITYASNGDYAYDVTSGLWSAKIDPETYREVYDIYAGAVLDRDEWYFVTVIE